MKSKYAQVVSGEVNDHEALFTPIRMGEHMRGAVMDSTFDTGLEEAEWITPNSTERSIHDRNASKALDQQFTDPNLGLMRKQK